VGGERGMIDVVIPVNLIMVVIFCAIMAVGIFLILLGFLGNSYMVMGIGFIMLLGGDGLSMAFSYQYTDDCFSHPSLTKEYSIIANECLQNNPYEKQPLHPLLWIWILIPKVNFILR
jgi:hypothetical protein